MKTFILEDNQSSRDLFRKYLGEDSPELKIIGEAASLEEARAFLARETPDLVLFDIDLPDGTSFDLLQELTDRDGIDFDIIFITAFDTQENIRQAMEFAALKYLSKPLNRHALRKAVGKALTRHRDKQMMLQQIRNLLRNTRPTPPTVENVAIPLTDGNIEMVNHRDILYIATYSKGKKSQVYLKDKAKPLISNRALGQFVDLLTGGLPFIQIHESHMINLNALQRYSLTERTVLLKNGVVLAVSRRCVKQLKERILGENDDTPVTPVEGNLIARVWRKLFH